MWSWFLRRCKRCVLPADRLLARTHSVHTMMHVHARRHYWPTRLLPTMQALGVITKQWAPFGEPTSLRWDESGAKACLDPVT